MVFKLKVMNRKLIFLWIVFGLFVLLPTAALAQAPVERSSEIVTIGGKEYYMHHVKQGQTLFGIAKAYAVTVEDIERLNPEVKNGLKAGNVIGISASTEQRAEPQPNAMTQPAAKTEQGNTMQTVGGDYTVQPGENLYDIAKKFGIDVSEFKALNPGLANEPKAGTVIKVPDIVNTDDYIVHKVEYNERTSSLLKRWKVTESEFREKNISVGSHVFVNQVVLIPIAEVSVTTLQPENEPKTEDDDELQQDDPVNLVVIDEDDFEMPECNVLVDNALRTYKVVLMAPLYLGNMGSLDVGKDQVAKAMKSRSMLFLQFYEGFMMAVDRLTSSEGLKLDLTVLDVTDNASTVSQAIGQLDDIDPDLIVGPFFAEGFNEVEAYAKNKGIIMVNPMSMRESIIEGNPNVVKVKAGPKGRIMDLSNLVKNHYSDANVFIVSQEREEDVAFLDALEQRLNQVVNENVSIKGEDVLDYARSESKRQEMGERMSPTVTVEGQVYSTSDLEVRSGEEIVLENPVKRYAYSEMSTLKSQLSGVRDNMVIAYGDNNVFATQVLNTLKKEADRKPITIVALPDWTKFEKLQVSSLLDMNAICFTDCFIDYRDGKVKDFVRQFRKKYRWDPHGYAFEGYDLARYFLTALMRYGTDMIDCLPNHDIELFHTRYHFVGTGEGNGMENHAWSIFQYDKEAIELNPIDPSRKPTDE